MAVTWDDFTDRDRLARRRHRHGQLVPIPPESCPVCGGSTSADEWIQAPLLRHGGYGAAERTSLRTCRPCRWSLIVSVSEERP